MKSRLNCVKSRLAWVSGRIVLLAQVFALCVPAMAEDATPDLGSDEEFARAVEYGFVSEEMAADAFSAITWKQFCEMAGRMIEACDADALPTWQEMTAGAPDTPMKRDGGMMSLLFAARS